MLAVVEGQGVRILQAQWLRTLVELEAALIFSTSSSGIVSPVL